MREDIEEVFVANGKIYKVGKRMWCGPTQQEVIVHKIYYSEYNLWDDPNTPEIGNVLVKYDDGVIGKCNNWQLCDLDDPKRSK